MAHDVFISYSTRDKPTADAVCAGLEKAGIRCWIAPRDIVAGVEWSQSIVGAIASAKVMVMLLSASANKSTQIPKEVDCAMNKGVTVIPLRIEDVRPTGALEYYLGTAHWLDALDPPMQAHIDQLARNVSALLSGTPLQPKAGPPPLRSTPPPARASRVGMWVGVAAGALVLSGAAGVVGWKARHREPGVRMKAMDAGPQSQSPVTRHVAPDRNAPQHVPPVEAGAPGAPTMAFRLQRVKSDIPLAGLTIEPDSAGKIVRISGAVVNEAELAEVRRRVAGLGDGVDGSGVTVKPQHVARLLQAKLAEAGVENQTREYKRPDGDWYLRVTLIEGRRGPGKVSGAIDDLSLARSLGRSYVFDESAVAVVPGR